MPEGDSVHRLARRLDTLSGLRVVRGDLRVPRLATADLAGARLVGTAARGKHLLTRLDTGWTLHSHLRMQGAWTVLGPGRRLPARVLHQLRASLSLDDGRTLVAVDMPVLDLVRTTDEASVVGHLGPDLLGPDWDADRACRRLRADPARPAIEALLDQRTVAGLGNLWAVELCFLRGVEPWTPVGAVDLPPLLALAGRMLHHSLEHRTGMATTGDTRPGRSHWVYGRAGRPCLRCGTPVAFRPATGRPYAREVWWCPSCQPAAG